MRAECSESFLPTFSPRDVVNSFLPTFSPRDVVNSSTNPYFLVLSYCAIAGDRGSIPGSGMSLGEGSGNPLRCSCLGNPMDRGAWRATVRGVAKSQT